MSALWQLARTVMSLVGDLCVLWFIGRFLWYTLTRRGNCPVCDRRHPGDRA